MQRTNAMRILTQQKINYDVYDYQDSGKISGLEVADYLKENPHQVFKTLVTVASSKEYYVFLVPVAKSLNLKKAAQVVKEKAVTMVKSKELLGLTGYVHGGCCPVGMKKQFKTVIDISSREYEDIFISGGKIGYQIKIRLDDLVKVIPAEFADICD